MKVLEKDFFYRETPLVAQDLLGKILATQIDDTIVSGIVVETEAYLGQNDLAVILIEEKQNEIASCLAQQDIHIFTKYMECIFAIM